MAKAQRANERAGNRTELQIIIINEIIYKKMYNRIGCFRGVREQNAMSSSVVKCDVMWCTLNVRPQANATNSFRASVCMWWNDQFKLHLVISFLCRCVWILLLKFVDVQIFAMFISANVNRVFKKCSVCLAMLLLSFNLVLCAGSSNIDTVNISKNVNKIWIRFWEREEMFKIRFEMMKWDGKQLESIIKLRVHHLFNACNCWSSSSDDN